MKGTITPGTHYSTFGGSPLSMLGISTLLEAGRNGLGANVLSRGAEIKDGLEGLRRFGVKDIRGRGLMIAIEFEGNLDARHYSEALFQQRMFVPTFRKNIMKFAPPLNINEADVKEGLFRIKAAFGEAFGSFLC